MRYFLSTLVSVGLLFAMLLLPLHIALSFFDFPGIFSIFLALLLIVLFWWFSDPLYDYYFSKIYGTRWISIKELQENHYALSIYLQDMLHKKGLKVRKLGILEDDRPIPITYGSSKGQIRLILSSGIFHHLDEKEQQAVLAHELGHMHYGDFAVLTAAYVPALISYDFARRLWRNPSKHHPFAAIGFVFYLLHLLLSIPVLLQSRIREYFADEFASEIANPNSLGTALAKISLAYISQGSRSKSDNLMEVGRPFAIIDFNMARNIALTYLNRKETGSWILTENIVLQDLYNPWPALFEIGTSHPLIGKRLLAICLKAERLHNTPFLDMQRMFAADIASSVLRINFLEDFLIYAIARFSPLLIAILLLLGHFHDKSVAIGVVILLYGLGMALLSLYSFSYVHFRSQTIKEQLEDEFASAIRGRPLILEGVIREKSSLGLDSPEDLIFADHSGEIYIGPRSLLPLVISPFMSSNRLMKLKDKRVKVRGWYLRGKYPKLIIDEVDTDNSKINGRQRLFDLGLASLIISAGLILIML
ncbi:MAG: M48 family metalloprotease [Candidatus Micrarchaeota archaeon]